MTEKCKQPYTFVPVVTEQAKVHDVIFHDGENNQDKLTGILQCTLTTKTPMIVGHFQYYVEQLNNLQKGKIEKVIIQKNGKGSHDIIKKTSEHKILPEGWEGCGYPQQSSENKQQQNMIAHKEKTILEPLFLNGTPESSVLISGTSLKGMVRQAIGAISNSPMERVAEKQFSYRPGLVYRNQREKTHYKLYEAKALQNLEKNSKSFKLEITDDDFSNGKTVFTVDDKMVKYYWKTAKTYENKEPPKKRKRRDDDYHSIKNGDIIFVEYNNKTNEILSFGNHEQYRWIYADTTTTIQIDKTGEHTFRPETHPHNDESVNKNGGKLTAARAMFGYVDGGEPDLKDKTDEKKKDDIKLGIGEKDYSRLAGRISINTAVEVINENETLADRFIQQSQNFNIPLRILSTPKASAVECYIDQSTKPAQGIFNTYGDFIGFEESGKPLSGRKFYWRWNPDTSDYQLQPDDAKNEYKDCIALAGSQSTIARYISKANRKFKFTVRFKDLTEAELGALLTALSPHLAAQDQGDYWQQIGHARPLGLGSVKIDVDTLKILQTKTKEDEDNNDLLFKDGDITTQIKEFKKSDLCNKESLQNWLSICKPVDRPRRYMTVRQHGGNRLSHIRKVRNAKNSLQITKCFEV